MENIICTSLTLATRIKLNHEYQRFHVLDETAQSGLLDRIGNALEPDAARIRKLHRFDGFHVHLLVALPFSVSA